MSINLSNIDNWKKELILSLALLPDNLYSIPELSTFFQIEEHEQGVFFDNIHDLYRAGFLKSENARYGIDPENIKGILSQFYPSVEQCPTIINYFIQKLERAKLNYDAEFQNIYRYIVSILKNISGKSLQLAQLSYLLSSYLTKFEKYDDALEYNQLAIDISETIDKKHPVVALFYRDKALIHKKMGNSEKAIFCSLKDIEILEKHAGKYDELLPDSYFALSKTYEGIHNYEKAVEFNLKAIQFEQKKKRKSRKIGNNISSLYHNLAYYYVKLNNMKNASLFINKAVETFNKGELSNENIYKILLRDQKRFNSLFEFEQFIIKYKYVMLGLVIVFMAVLIWAIVNLLK